MPRPLTRAKPLAAHACRGLVLASLLMPLAACGPPDPPEKERKPEPQATQLGEATDSPIERARQVQPELEQAEERQRQAIEESGG